MLGPIGDTAKGAAFKQVMDYFEQNQCEMGRVIQTEVDVSLEKDGYILRGKVDLLLGSDGKLELLDFKTSPRPRGEPRSDCGLRTAAMYLCPHTRAATRATR